MTVCARSFRWLMASEPARANRRAAGLNALPVVCSVRRGLTAPEQGVRTASPGTQATVRRRQCGFTLLELLVAVTLMSVLALLSWRSLDALIGARERISRSGDDLRALVVAFAQIEEDLRRAWPVRLVETGRPMVLVRDAFDDRNGLAGGQLDLLREAPAVAGLASSGTGDLASAHASGLQRVFWRLEGGRLERGFSPWRPGDRDPPVDAGGPFAVAGVVWQPLVDRVDALGWRLHVAGRGWIGAGGGGDTAEPIITGVEISLIRAGERIVRVFSVKD